MPRPIRSAQSVVCAAGPLTAWRRGERGFGIGNRNCGDVAEMDPDQASHGRGANFVRPGKVVLCRLQNDLLRKSSFAPPRTRGGEGKSRSDEPDSEKNISSAQDRTLRQTDGFSRPANSLKTRENHQVSVKRDRARPLICVVFSQQKCRFHTAFNFHRWNRCASIPRVLSAPAPGVTP